MIVYDSKKWRSVIVTMIKTFRTAYNVKKILLFMFITLIYSITVTYYNLRTREAVRPKVLVVEVYQQQLSATVAVALLQSGECCR